MICIFSQDVLVYLNYGTHFEKENHKHLKEGNYCDFINYLRVDIANDMANRNWTTVWWIIIIFIVITVIGIIFFVFVDRNNQSDQITTLQQPAGGSCRIDSDCLSGLTCQNSVCTAPTSPKGNIGDTCQIDEDCTTGLSCQNNICVTILTSPPTGDIGSSCRSDGDCMSNLRCENMFCRAKINSNCTQLTDCVREATSCTKMTKICSLQPLPGAGGSCSDLPCQQGFTCQANLCRAPIGGQCQDDNGCPTGSGGCQNGICVNPSGLLNDPCIPVINSCQENLDCDAGSGNLCKVSDGSDCSQDNDCKSTSSCRMDRSQYRSSRKVCLPNTPLFEHCTVNHECASGLCGNSRLMVQTQGTLNQTHTFQHQLVDVIQEGDNTLMLLADGNITREKISSNMTHRLEMIKNNVKLEQFASLGLSSDDRTLYGLCRGRLYQLNRKASSRNSWFWELTNWAPSEITHISCTHDGNYMWLQFPMKYPPPSLPTPLSSTEGLRSSIMSINTRSKQYGYLYRYGGTNEQPALIKQTLLSEGIKRTYGRNDVCYLEADTFNSQAIRYPKGDMITNYHVGILMSDGSVYKVNMESEREIRTVRLIGGNPHLITNCQCLPMEGSYSRPTISPTSSHLGMIYHQP